MARDPMFIERGLPTTLPRPAYVKGLGTVSVTEYRGNGYYLVVPKKGQPRIKRARAIKFLKPKPTKEST